MTGRRRQVAIALLALALGLLGAGCGLEVYLPPEPPENRPEPPGRPPPGEPPPNRPPTPPAASGPLGYVGPSVVTRIAGGVSSTYPSFGAWNGTRLVRLNGYGFDGCDTYRWSRPDGEGEYCWRNFRQMLSAHPGTDRLLFMVAFKPGREMSVAATREVLGTLRSACSAALGRGRECGVVVSGLPDFIGTCGRMEPSGVPALTRDIARQIAQTTPGVTLGPTFSAIRAAETTDGCHQDQRKRGQHASELVGHLGGG